MVAQQLGQIKLLDADLNKSMVQYEPQK